MPKRSLSSLTETVPEHMTAAFRLESNSGIAKRARRPRSCESCRTRKLRCDRARPACNNCIARLESSACSYQEPTGIPSPNSTQAQRRAKDNDSVKEEQHGLSSCEYSWSENEGLLPESQAAEPWARSPKPSGIDNRFSALLHQLAQKSSNGPRTGSMREKDRLLPLAPVQTLPVSTLLLHLPSRATCTTLVATYFLKQHPAMCIVHKPSFLEDLERFWAAPSAVSLSWLGLLFGMLRIAAIKCLWDDDEPPELEGKCADLAALFRLRTLDCLNPIDYTEPPEYLVETLLLQEHGDYASNPNSNPGIWILHGTIVRTSMARGYHLPATRQHGLSPFQLEMRSRAWAFIRELEVLLAFQSGMPPYLQESDLQIDERMPRNLNDDDFHRETTVMPPGKPSSEVTKSSYLIAKLRLAIVLSSVLRETSTSAATSPQRITQLEDELTATYYAMPQEFRISNESEDKLRVTARVVLANTFHKIRCILHMRALHPEARGASSQKSRAACEDSAKQLISLQWTLHSTLHKSAWRYQTSIATHDYLFAALLLSRSLRFYQGDCTGSGTTQANSIIAALEKCLIMFSARAAEHTEAKSAAASIEILLNQCRSAHNMEHNVDDEEIQQSFRSPMENTPPALPTSNVHDPSLADMSTEFACFDSMAGMDLEGGSDLAFDAEDFFAHALTTSSWQTWSFENFWPASDD